MQTTKSILSLWVGSSACACFVTFGFAYNRGIVAVTAMENLDLEGGKSFALGLPSLVSWAIALSCAVLALAGLLVSWRVNKQPLLSGPHIAALIFLIPMGLVLIYAAMIAA